MKKRSFDLKKPLGEPSKEAKKYKSAEEFVEDY